MNSRRKAKAPKAFISYSWDSETHQSWVQEFATRLRANGIDAILDQWHLTPGDELAEFMERAIRRSDYVLIICTPRYKQRSDSRIGGVGFEEDIMTAQVLTRRNHRKFIPILREGSWRASAPTWLSGKSFLDFRKPEHHEASYRLLFQTLHRRKSTVPPLGQPPGPLFEVKGFDRRYSLKAVLVLFGDDTQEIRLFHGNEWDLYNTPVPDDILEGLAHFYNSAWDNHSMAEDAWRDILQSLCSPQCTSNIRIEGGRVFRPGPWNVVTLRFRISPTDILSNSSIVKGCHLTVWEHDLEIDLWAPDGNNCKYNENDLSELKVDFQQLSAGASKLGESFGLRRHQSFYGPWVQSGDDGPRGFPYLLMELG